MAEVIDLQAHRATREIPAAVEDLTSADDETCLHCEAIAMMADAMALLEEIPAPPSGRPIGFAVIYEREVEVRVNPDRLGRYTSRQIKVLAEEVMTEVVAAWMDAKGLLKR